MTTCGRFSGRNGDGPTLQGPPCTPGSIQRSRHCVQWYLCTCLYVGWICGSIYSIAIVTIMRLSSFPKLKILMSDHNPLMGTYTHSEIVNLACLHWTTAPGTPAVTRPLEGDHQANLHQYWLRTLAWIYATCMQRGDTHRKLWDNTCPIKCTVKKTS